MARSSDNQRAPTRHKTPFSLLTQTRSSLLLQCDKSSWTSPSTLHRIFARTTNSQVAHYRHSFFWRTLTPLSTNMSAKKVHANGVENNHLDKASLEQKSDADVGLKSDSQPNEWAQKF